MNNRLLVFRKMSPDDPVNHLIAILYRDKNGEITIGSRLDDRELSRSYSIPVLSSPETETVEEYKTRVRKWLDTFLPPADNEALKEALMKKAGMTEYDEWEWLKRFRPDSRSLISFSNIFPKNYKRHDLRLPCIDENDSHTFLINQEYEESDLDIDLVDDSCFDDDFDDLDHDEAFTDEDPTAWEEWLAKDGEDEDDRMTCDDFEVYDENTTFPFPLFEEDADSNSEKPVFNLETFSKSQSDSLVTNKTTIRKTFEAFAEVPLMAYIGGLNGTDEFMDKLSKMGGVSINQLRGFTVYDMINRFSAKIYANDEIPDDYDGNIIEVYKILSVRVGNNIIKKPIRTG